MAATSALLVMDATHGMRPVCADEDNDSDFEELPDEDDDEQEEQSRPTPASEVPPTFSDSKRLAWQRRVGRERERIAALEAGILKMRKEMGLDDDATFEAFVQPKAKRRGVHKVGDVGAQKPRRKQREPKPKKEKRIISEKKPTSRKRKSKQDKPPRAYKNGYRRSRPEQTFYNRVKQGQKCLEKFRARGECDPEKEQRLEAELEARRRAKAEFDEEWAKIEERWKDKLESCNVRRLFGDTAKAHKRELEELVAQVEENHALGKMK